jgi:hypothetical protein
MRVDVGDAGKTHPQACGDVAGMDVADPTRTNHRDAQHLAPPLPVCCVRE